MRTGAATLSCVLQHSKVLQVGAMHRLAWSRYRIDIPSGDQVTAMSTNGTKSLLGDWLRLGAKKGSQKDRKALRKKDGT